MKKALVVTAVALICASPAAFGDWQQFTVTINGSLGEHAIACNLFDVLNGGNLNGPIYFDDLSVTFDGGSNVLGNGDFEDGNITDAWMQYNSGNWATSRTDATITSSTDEAHGGTHSMKWGPVGTGSTNPNIYIVGAAPAGATSATFSGWVELSCLDSVSTFHAQISDVTGGYSPLQVSSDVPGETAGGCTATEGEGEGEGEGEPAPLGWQPFTVTLSGLQAGDAIAVNLFASTGTSQFGAVYVDDMVISYNNGTDLMSNGGFELGDTSETFAALYAASIWTISGAGTLIEAWPYFARSGDYSLQLTPGSTANSNCWAINPTPAGASSITVSGWVNTDYLGVDYSFKAVITNYTHFAAASTPLFAGLGRKAFFGPDVPVAGLVALGLLAASGIIGGISIIRKKK